jgi:hypothetical protein
VGSERFAQISGQSAPATDLGGGGRLRKGPPEEIVLRATAAIMPRRRERSLELIHDAAERRVLAVLHFDPVFASAAAVGALAVR